MANRRRIASSLEASFAAGHWVQLVANMHLFIGSWLVSSVSQASLSLASPITHCTLRSTPHSLKRQYDGEPSYDSRLSATPIGTGGLHASYETNQPKIAIITSSLVSHRVQHIPQLQPTSSGNVCRATTNGARVGVAGAHSHWNGNAPARRGHWVRPGGPHNSIPPRARGRRRVADRQGMCVSPCLP